MLRAPAVTASPSTRIPGVPSAASAAVASRANLHFSLTSREDVATPVWRCAGNASWGRVPSLAEAATTQAGAVREAGVEEKDDVKGILDLASMSTCHSREQATSSSMKNNSCSSIASNADGISKSRSSSSVQKVAARAALPAASAGGSMSSSSTSPCLKLLSARKFELRKLRVINRQGEQVEIVSLEPVLSACMQPFKGEAGWQQRRYYEDVLVQSRAAAAAASSGTTTTYYSDEASFSGEEGPYSGWGVETTVALLLLRFSVALVVLVTILAGIGSLLASSISSNSNSGREGTQKGGGPICGSGDGVDLLRHCESSNGGCASRRASIGEGAKMSCLSEYGETASEGALASEDAEEGPDEQDVDRRRCQRAALEEGGPWGKKWQRPPEEIRQHRESGTAMLVLPG
ncbi:hypothetical protein cyc_03404 [Cyclospora cayetanensis]|uniref:Transmembrane protein n=1 Tax=Cyclospora cayetanensis TaxID=88456 RepID=A0A1D3D5K6_9EIME|nr:hypothetical protein cyc_03404 [Cyclospora cayetanensis]